MTQEEKSLLLKDLAARLPFGVILANGAKVRSIDVLTKIVSGIGTDKKIEDTKYYLRPMSSMTKEEKNEYDSFFNLDYGYMDAGAVFDVADWINAHHFDYRGLIKKGLAIEITEENNPYEQNKS